jgi:hypothetical protein
MDGDEKGGEKGFHCGENERKGVIISGKRRRRYLCDGDRPIIQKVDSGRYRKPLSGVRRINDISFTRMAGNNE